MRCPSCGHDDTRVIDSRAQDTTNAIKRRRECRSCGYRFTTFERCEDPIEVIKSDGSVQPFDRNKLLNALIDDIERELRGGTLTAIRSHDIGDMVLKRLERIDKVAYIRFASVYRDFRDVDEFISELDKLR